MIKCDFHAWSKRPEVTQCCYRASSLQQTTCMKLPGVGGVGFNGWLFSTMQLMQLEMFPMCDALVVPSTLSNQLLVWCCHKSWNGWPMIQHGVPVSNPSISCFFKEGKKSSGQNQNIHRFSATSCLGIVPSEIHVKSRCSNLRNWNRNMAMTPCSL